MGAIHTKARLMEGLAALAARDADLARALDAVGPPPLRNRRADFDSLFGIICAQQVSTAAARAIRTRLQALAHPLTPTAVLRLGEDALRGAGLSRQKVAYGLAIAEAIVSGRFDLARVARLDDDAAIAELTTLKGIGRWSAEIYLLFALKRPDLWPAGDLGIVKGTMGIKGLRKRPSETELVRIAEDWRPWRSVAARLVWHHYGAAPEK